MRPDLSKRIKCVVYVRPERSAAIANVIDQGARGAMREAEEFNRFYETADPWGLKKIGFRDRILQRIIPPHIVDKSVLAGC